MKKARALTVAIFVAFTSIVFTAATAHAAADIALSAASSKPTYKAGERISISLSLLNRGKKPLAVSGIDLGAVAILSVRRNGARLIGRPAGVRVDEELGTALFLSLHTLQAGESGQLTLESTVDPETKTAVLRTVRYVANQSPAATLFPVSQSGAYSVTVVYQFPRMPKVPLDTFLGRTNLATVTFSVQ